MMKHKLLLLVGFLLVYSQTVLAQDQTVSGTVTDAGSGETLPGVSVVLEGTDTGTTTNLDGEFELPVPSLEETLQFS